MSKTPHTLVLCTLMSLIFLSKATAQPALKEDNALKAVLLSRRDEFMSAWKRHDSKGVAAVLAAEFVAVDGGSMATGVDDTVKGLMSCNLMSYHIAESSLKRASPNAFILITKQEQQISCSGHLAPAVVFTTDTYVKRGGKWLILVHTEAAPGR